mgnify:CR=1 FL=1
MTSEDASIAVVTGLRRKSKSPYFGDSDGAEWRSCEVLAAGKEGGAAKLGRYERALVGPASGSPAAVRSTCVMCQRPIPFIRPL